jgi:hypothetical protein
MADPQIHGRRSSFSASNVLNALGRGLTQIRDGDGLTWKDVGRALGKSEDRAAQYAGGSGDMGVISFLLGCREWNGRFANEALAMIGMKLVPLDRGEVSDRRFSTILAEMMAAWNKALEDGEVTEEELVAMQALLDATGRAVDARKTKPKLEAVP